MIGVAIALAVAANQFPGFEPKGRWVKPTTELATEVLAPEQAQDAVSHSFEMSIFQYGAPSSVRFFGRPRATGDGFCERRNYYVSILVKGGKGEGQPQPPITGDGVRLGSCDGLFAFVNPGGSLDAAKRALRWIEWAQQTARGSSPLPFRLGCTSETDHNRCALGARTVLASLPLGKAMTITRDFYRRDHRWQISVTETELGQLYWDVAIDASPENPSIDLTWKIPAPF